MNNGVVFADFDGTIIRGQSQVMLVKYLFLRNEIGTGVLLKVLFWNLKYRFVNQKIDNKFAEGVYKLILSGRDEQQTTELLKSFVNDILGKALNERVIEIIRKYKNDKYRVIFVSSTLDIILKAFLDEYSLADEVICTILEKKEGKFTGRIVGRINDGKNRNDLVVAKIKALEPSDIIVISDNLTDIELLKGAGKAIVVNPNNELAKFAKKLNFEIIET